MNAPTRPVLRWHGGKWKLAPWIISHFPPHRIYVEPFGGAASVLLRKDPSFSEIYNDLDTDVVNLFSVLRDERAAARLIDVLRLTPFARAEFDESYERTDDPIERARRLIIRSYMGYGSDSAHTSGNTGFRAQSPSSGRSPEKDWFNYPPALARVVARVVSVVIECRPAVAVMARHDSPETLHYVDPPYMPETRSTKSRKSGEKYHVYQHEMTSEEHRELLEFLRSLAGMVVLSGYPHDLYEQMLGGGVAARRNGDSRRRWPSAHRSPLDQPGSCRLARCAGGRCRLAFVQYESVLSHRVPGPSERGIAE